MMIKILFVCTGNICRSPTAEAVLRHFAAADRHSLEVDSAGTHGYHIGEPPDTRSIQAAKRRGFSMESLRARKINMNDFRYFDVILGLDHDHVSILQNIAPPDATAKIDLFLRYAANENTPVPDPYYGKAQDFEHVLDLSEHGARALLTQFTTTPR